MQLTSRTLGGPRSPIGVVQALLAERRQDVELIDLSQGVPTYPPAPQILKSVEAAVHSPESALYAPRAGLPELREQLAEELSSSYRGKVTAEQVLITAGCNQAFCIAVSALAGAGDEVILPVPYYFNHDMWLRLDHLVPVHAPVGPDFVPDPEQIERFITARTRAIVLVTPSNPTGATISPLLIQEFAALAARRGLVLILDETYRSFRAETSPAHDLFSEVGWDDHVVSLHSFSKEFALPGYRVGALVGHPRLLVEAGKLLDCVAICAPRLAQTAALAGLRTSMGWRSERAEEMTRKVQLFRTVMSDAPGGFALRSSGAFFGWVQYERGAVSADDLAHRLIVEQAVAVLPGTLFMPTDNRYLRFSVSALAEDHFDDLRERLRAFEQG